MRFSSRHKRYILVSVLGVALLFGFNNCSQGFKATNNSTKSSTQSSTSAPPSSSQPPQNNPPNPPVGTSPVDGVCGLSNGISTSQAPSVGLCSVGIASTVSGSGPWNWTCAGTNGGTTAICVAPDSSTQIISTASVGWTDLKNTALINFAPNPLTDSLGNSIRGDTGPVAIVGAWSGAAADTTRNRLIIWGGGHADYFGNEVYALNLQTQTMARLNNPSPIDFLTTNPQGLQGNVPCPDALSDGAPSSRHTYDTLVYIPGLDQMYSFGGSKSTCGFLSDATWTLQFPGLQWTNKNPSGPQPPGVAGATADYDPNSKLVYLNTNSGFYSYNPTTNNYVLLNGNVSLDYHFDAVIDPIRKLYIMVEPPTTSQYGQAIGGVKVIDISGNDPTYSVQDWTSAAVAGGCAPMMVDYPGLTFDSKTGLIVDWPNSGNTVYTFNPNTKTCTTQTFTGGPGVSPTNQNGTFGRFRYFPALDEFGLVNDATTDAFILKLP